MRKAKSKTAAKRAISLALCLILVFSFASIAAAKGKPVKIIFKEKLTMLKGTSDCIGGKYFDSKTKFSFSSDDKTVASISSDGRINAKKSGIAHIRCEALKNGVAVVMKLRVKVLISRNSLIKAKGTAISKTRSAKKLPVYIISKQIQKGSASRISVVCLKKGEKVLFSSNKTSVASVDSSGKIVAKAAGSAVITAKAKHSGKTFYFKERVIVADRLKDETVSTAERNSFFSTSAFVGNSVGLGQKYYFDRQGSGYLGNPLMLVRGCYSFYNDKVLSTSYVPLYKGTPMRVKDSIKKSGVDKAFINMGTNDFYSSAQNTYEQYVEYLEGIRSLNPTVAIFIESTTGVHANGQKRVLNSANVRKLNELMKDYCSKNKNMYYIDITTRMLDSYGYLSSSCCSDNYVHLTNKAYELWMEDVISFCDNLLIRQQNVEDAVKTAEESRNPKLIKTAKGKANTLKSSTFKSRMLDRINAIKAK